MGAIFLSYSREDAGSAEALARLLEKAGHEVWWDRRIDGGDEFAEEIEAALRDSDLVLVAWSRHSTKSPWVRDEASTGRDDGKLLPVTLDGSRPPMGFRQYQTFDLTGWKGGIRDKRIAALLRSIDHRFENKNKPRAHVECGPLPFWRRTKYSSRHLLIAGAALGLVLATAAVFVARQQRAPEPASLAVLPFKNMSAGPPYFAEGVAEEISNQLSREPGFEVTGRTSADLFKDAADLTDVGRRLHVAYVLEGSVRSAGKQVLVDVALVETRKGVRLWSQDFNGNLDQIFAIQRSIGEQVAGHVRRQLSPTLYSSSTKTTGNVYALYLTARSLMRQREPGKLNAAVDLLQRAVKLDPNYAPAWARLALAEQLNQFYNDQPLSRADHIRDAEHAIALAPRLADAHAILGLLLTNVTDASENRRARQELETAVQLDAGNAEAWYWLSNLRVADLDFVGALNALRRTSEIDPFFVHSQHFPPLAWSMGYREEADRALANVISNNPDPFMREVVRAQLADLHYDLAGAYEHGKAALAIAPPDLKDIPLGPMGTSLLRLGLLERAEQIVPRPIVDLRRGLYTFNQKLTERFPHSTDYWNFAAEDERLLPRVILKIGRSSEIVSLYDATFSSADDMASRYSHSAFILNAPVVALALQRVGRAREGAKIIVLADLMCRRSLARPPMPLDYRVKCSRVGALAGRRDEAIRALQQAVAEGWRPSDGEYSNVTEEPAYANVRNDPRMKRIDSIIATDIDRERKELLRAGL